MVFEFNLNQITLCKLVDKAVSKLLKKAKKAGRKLMRKLGIGKGDKKKKQKGDKDERTPAEMQADLKKGIQEATMFVKGGETDKKKIKKKFDKIEKKYDLVELKLVVDKLNPEGKDKAHVHGEVNPVIDGDSFDTELDGAGGEPTDVKTHVTNTLDGEGRPTMVTANPLTWKRGNTKGSKPRQKPLGWDYANSGIREGVYIRGHLLNDNIHGPGVNWNMVPITRTMNSTMEAQAESKGKEVIDNKNKIMFYEVNVDEYYATPHVLDSF